MSWLYSIIFAGLIFTTDGDLPNTNIYNYTDSNVRKIVRQDETERFEQTYPFSSNGRVSVSNVNGSITIETWDRNEIKLTYVKTADTRENLSEVEVRINARQDVFRIETDYGESRRRTGNERRSFGKLQVEYQLTVPRNAALSDIETVNGSIRISNAANTTKASAVNGAVRATNLRGTANLSTVNGTVEADFDVLQTGSRISLDAVNGSVNLIIPSDANATVKADTLNGSITNDFGLPVRKGQYVGRDMHGRIGNGDVQIRLNSVNGGLSVKRKNDGKNANPATNLLPLKEGDDFDSAKINAEISKAVAAANKETNKALIQAQKELVKIQPEIEKITVEALAQTGVLINPEEMKSRIRESRSRQGEAQAQARITEAFVSGSSSIERKNGSFAVKNKPKINIEAANCAVSVRGWDKQEVSYSLTKISKSRNAAPLNHNVTQNGSDINIKVSGEPDAAQGGIFPGEMNRVQLEIFVPKKANLKIVTDGAIRLEGVTGDIDLRGGDEAINVRDAEGTLRAATADGRIRVIGFRGTIDAKTEDGTMSFEGDLQNLSAQTVDGTIILTLPENADANIESDGKQVIAEGFALIPQTGKGTPVWKIGNGGTKYRMNSSADGKVIVRKLSNLQAKQ